MKNILLILLLFSITVGQNIETEFFISDNDTIVVNIQSNVIKKEVFRSYEFYYNNNFMHRLNLSKVDTSYDVFLNLDTSFVYLIHGGIALKAKAFVIFRFDEKFLNETWKTYEPPRHDKLWNYADLHYLEITLENVYYSYADTLYQFIVDDDGDFLEEYTFDQKLHLREMGYINNVGHKMCKKFIRDD